MTSREFNQDTSGAKRAARQGPVYVTDRGQPAHVLLAFEDYESLARSENLADALSHPIGIENVDIEFPRPADPPRSTTI